MKNARNIVIPLFLFAIWFGNLGNVVEVRDSYGSSFLISSVPLIRT